MDDCGFITKSLDVFQRMIDAILVGVFFRFLRLKKRESKTCSFFLSFPL